MGCIIRKVCTGDIAIRGNGTDRGYNVPHWVLCLHFLFNPVFQLSTAKNDINLFDNDCGSCDFFFPKQVRRRLSRNSCFIFLLLLSCFTILFFYNIIWVCGFCLPKNTNGLVFTSLFSVFIAIKKTLTNIKYLASLL